MLRIGIIMYQTSFTKGQELVAQRMVKEFRRQGFDAFLITSIYHDGEPVVPIEEVMKRGGYIHLYDTPLGLPVIRVNSERATWPPRRILFRDFMSVLTSLVEELKLNVIISHSTLWNGPEEVAKFIAWRRQLIESGSVHEPLLFCHMSHFQEPIDERYMLDERSYREAWNNFSLTQVIREADFILVTTPLEEAAMWRLGATKDQCIIFPGGIDDEVLEAYDQPKELRDRYKVPKGAKTVTYLGTIEERKNPLAVIEVAQILANRRDVHFVIAGNAEGDYGSKVREEASKLQNVSLLGAISDEEKTQLIRESYLNIILSRSEALGLAQLEFMYAGVPVISSGIGGQSWIVNDGANGIILDGPDDIEGAAKAIKELVEHPSRREKLSRRARRFASSYSITRLIHSLSKSLTERLRKVQEGSPSRYKITPGERALEAWVRNGRRVVVTTKRVMIGSVGNAKEVMITIPLEEILRIRRHIKAFWSILFAGTGATVVLIAAKILGLQPGRVVMDVITGGASTFGLGVPVWISLLRPFIPFVPLALAIVIFVLTMKKGYMILYGTSNSAFLPETFLKALRLVDKFTPRDLFSDS